MADDAEAMWRPSSRTCEIRRVIDKESTGVVFSYNVKKGNFQSAAESFARHLKDHIAGKD